MGPPYNKVVHTFIMQIIKCTREKQSVKQHNRKSGATKYAQASPVLSSRDSKALWLKE